MSGDLLFRHVKARVKVPYGFLCTNIPKDSHFLIKKSLVLVLALANVNRHRLDLLDQSSRYFVTCRVEMDWMALTLKRKEHDM